MHLKMKQYKEDLTEEEITTNLVNWCQSHLGRSYGAAMFEER